MQFRLLKRYLEGIKKRYTLSGMDEDSMPDFFV